MERKERDVSKNDASPYDLLGAVPLRKGEDRQAFFKLRNAIEPVLKPSNILEYADVQDIALKMWEVARLKRIQNGISDSPAALANFLSIAFDDNELKAKNVALRYFSKDTCEARQATELLAEHLISEDQIETHAMTSQIFEYRVLDHLIQYRELTGNKLVRRALKRLAKRLRGDPSQTEDIKTRVSTTKAIGTVLPLPSSRRRNGD